MIKIKKIIKYIIILLLIIFIAISSFFVYKNLNEDRKQEETFNKLIEIVTSDNKKNFVVDENTTTETINIKKLYEVNNDIVAWIKIDDTDINYPIMQNKFDKNYYLRRDFYKQYSYWGTPFLADNCDINTSTNLIIYGHHINNSKMFGELENYKNKNYYDEHKNIQLFTLEEKREYEIIAVFKTTVYTGFKYYNFINANNEGEFNTFLNKCKELSFFDTGNTARYGDKLLTLSTCDYSENNGRLVIVAKMLE